MYCYFDFQLEATENMPMRWVKLTYNCEIASRVPRWTLLEVDPAAVEAFVFSS